MTELPRRLEANAKLAADPEQALKEVYVDVDKALGTEAVANNPKLEPLFSGTTAVVVYMRENTMWAANAGDSRAVLCTRHGSTVMWFDEVVPCVDVLLVRLLDARCAACWVATCLQTRTAPSTSHETTTQMYRRRKREY